MIWQIGITPSAVRQMITTEEDLLFYQFVLLLRRHDIQLVDLSGSLNRCVMNLLQEKTLNAAQRQKVRAVVELIGAAASNDRADAVPGCLEEKAWCKIWGGFAKWVDHVLCSNEVQGATPPMCEISQLLAEVGYSALPTSWEVQRTLNSQRRPMQRILQAAEWLVVVIPHAGHARGSDSEICSGVQLLKISRELVRSQKSLLNRIDFLLYPGGDDHDSRDRAYSDAKNRLDESIRAHDLEFDVQTHRLLSRELERRIYLGKFREHRGQRVRTVTAGVAVTHYAHNDRPSRSSILPSRWSVIDGSAARAELWDLNESASLGFYL